MSRYIVAPAARDDIDAIWDYIGIENENPAAADRVIDKMFEKFALIATQPLMAERCHEFEHLVPGLRRSVVDKYVIYYTPMEDGVRIGHIAHGMMDQDALFRHWLTSRDFEVE
jgi:toxin ParE1/3/4